MRVKIRGEVKEIKEGERLISILSEPDIIAARVNGKLVDLSYQPQEGDVIEPITFDDDDGKQIYWHSTAHIMAQAVKELFPNAKLAIGPAIEKGFYYDFEVDRPFTTEDLEKIEAKMHEIIAKDLKFERLELPRDEARRMFEEMGEKFKVELIDEISDDVVSCYKQGDFIDLCRGPHVPSTGRIKYFKLLSTSGSYWRGDETRERLQRIYGISFTSKEKLDHFLQLLKEAEACDHRKLGTQLEYYSIGEPGPGLVLWHPKGATIRRIIEEFWIKEHIKRGYQLVYTPHIAKAELWQISGHFEYYRENMITFKMGQEDYVLKPMNCPFHILIYKSKIRSYRDLPIKYAELGTVYRYERSGVLHGLLRVRGFTQDDAHIFCRPDQVETEICEIIELARYMMEKFGFKEYDVTLSVRDPADKKSFAGRDEDWQHAETALENVLKKLNIPYERMVGEAAFYGPKIDIHLRDAMGRKWQGPTIQFDFNLPERFDVTYIGADNTPHNVVMIHRAILGAMERFMGTLVEHHKGAMPFWLAPVQIVVATITDAVIPYAQGIYRRLTRLNYRVELDTSNEKISYKVRMVAEKKIPYMVIVGKKEMESGRVAVRKRGEGDLGSMEWDAFMELLRGEENPLT